MDIKEADPAGIHLPGRSKPAYEVGERHAVLDNPLRPPFPDGIEIAFFAAGCYWALERLFWQVDGVYSAAVGFTGGSTPNPTGEEVESGKTGHAETVRIAYWPREVDYAELVKAFFEGHDPTQGMRQGTEIGPCYRSATYFTTAGQRAIAEIMRGDYARSLRVTGHGRVTTEIAPAGAFYYGPDSDQQYLHKHRDALHCALVGTGVPCRIPPVARIVA